MAYFANLLKAFVLFKILLFSEFMLLLLEIRRLLLLARPVEGPEHLHRFSDSKIFIKM